MRMRWRWGPDLLLGLVGVALVAANGLLGWAEIQHGRRVAVGRAPTGQGEPVIRVLVVDDQVLVRAGVALLPRTAGGFDRPISRVVRPFRDRSDR